MSDRLKKALEDADLAFWAAIGDSYPEITTGDLDPGSVIEFNQASEAVVKQWLYYNSSELTGQELATTLAALRHWQSSTDGKKEKLEKDIGGHFSDFSPLDRDEIDDLCEKINV